MSFTLEDVAQKAIELAEADPDFVYKAPDHVFTPEEVKEAEESGRTVDEYFGEPSCKYVHDTEAGPVGGCLFGQALMSLGLDADGLRDFEGLAVTDVLKGHGRDVSIYEGLGLAMSLTQQQQDSGNAWGEAIKPLKKAMGK